jgi:hypothetical protein
MGDMKRWKQKRYWIQACKALFTLVPVMIIYAVIATKGLVAVCAEKPSFPNWWCEVGSVGYAIVAVIIARFFYAWLKPKEPEE